MQYFHGTEKLKTYPSIQLHQVPERIDSLDNNNPLKIYTKLTSASACTTELAHTRCTSRDDDDDEREKKMITDGPTISLLNSVGCSICLCSENASPRMRTMIDPGTVSARCAIHQMKRRHRSEYKAIPLCIFDSTKYDSIFRTYFLNV